MNKVLNWGIALLLPSLICCGSGKKTQDVPEEIYACPMPGDPWTDEPEEEKTASLTEDSTQTAALKGERTLRSK